MILEYRELEYLKDSEILRQKIDEILEFVREKGFTVEDSSFTYSLRLENDKFLFQLPLSIPVQRL